MFDSVVQVGLPELVDGAPGPAPARLPGDRVLPVVPSLAELFPGGGLRRGSVVAVGGWTTLSLAVLAGPSRAGSWTAAVGLPELGVRAAAEAGVDLSRFAIVPRPGSRWMETTAALVDALDVVLVRPASRVRPGAARALAARVRERGAVLLVTGDWPDPPELRVEPTAAEWEGLGAGAGRLRRRRVELRAQGRGAAARERRVRLWLPEDVAWAASAP